MKPKILACEDCTWTGAETHTKLRRERSGVSEHCPICSGDRLCEVVYTRLRLPTLEVHPHG
jgi:hypothetical protein